MLLPLFQPEGGVPVILLRGCTVAGTLAAFGALLFDAAVAPPVLARLVPVAAAAYRMRWRRLTRGSLLAAILALLGWLLAESALLSGAVTLGAVFSALPTVLGDTVFGHVVLAQAVALLLTAVLLANARGRSRMALVAAAGATILQAGHSHAMAMQPDPSLLLLSSVVHLLAAGAWLGGLAPLLLLVRAAPPAEAARACRRFSRLGLVCVLLLAASAAWQFTVLIGGLPGLIGTAYGLTALLKLALFLVLLGLAAAHRFRFTPALGGVAGERAKRRLAGSIAVETGVGLAVVLAAALLTSLPPSMHVQPLWPFAERLSLSAVREDADFRREVIGALLAIAGAAALLVLAALVRRIRWPTIAVAFLIGVFAMPHLDLLLAEANPDSFFHSPTGFAATSIVEGASLFPVNCAVCHGAQGRGDGPAAHSLPVPPADLTAAHLWMHSDGDLFWWLSHGIPAPDGRPAMPGFAGTLTVAQRWALIDYIRAHNAGLVMSSTGTWSPPIRAPALRMVCGGRSKSLADLRGQVVRLLIAQSPERASVGVVTVVADPPPSDPATADCVTDDTAAAAAFAIVAGLPPAQADDAEYLIDGDGWLRAVQRPGAATTWDDPSALAAAVAGIRAHPLRAGDGAMPMDMPMNMKM